MPKKFTSDSQKIGETGENIAVRFLMKHSFTIIERNYTKKWGELDIVAKKENVIHFIEVKSVSYGTSNERVSYETHRPEDNMHHWKAKRMARTIQTYLLQRKIPEETTWQIDLLVVYLNLKDKKATVKIIKDIIL